MDALHKLEDQLAPLFKDLPEIPKGFKEFLVQYWPIIALVVGALQLLAAIGLLGSVAATSMFLTTAGYAAGVAYTGINLFAAYIGIALLLINAIIFFLAFSPLTKKAKKGWDLLFLSTIINLVYGASQVFIGYSGFSSLIGSLVGTAIGLYLLFQIRSYYGTKKTAKTTGSKPEALK